MGVATHDIAGPILLSILFLAFLMMSSKSTSSEVSSTVSGSYQTRDSVTDSRDDPADDSSPTKFFEIDKWSN